MNRILEVDHSLHELGLGEHEANVYIALLTHGPCRAGVLVKETKLHRQFVYIALGRLLERELIRQDKIRNRHRFEALDPSQMVAMQHRRVRIAEGILPSLKSLWSERREGVEVELRYGRDEFFLNLERVASSASRGDKVMRIIGGASDKNFYSFLGRRYQEYVNLLKRYGVKKHLLAPEGSTTLFKKKFVREGVNQLRTLEEGLSAPTYTRITKEMISIEIYTDEPTILRVQNSIVAKSYLDHFNLLWKRAKVFE